MTTARRWSARARRRFAGGGGAGVDQPTMGRPCAMSPERAFQRCASSWRRARVLTISPWSRKFRRPAPPGRAARPGCCAGRARGRAWFAPACWRSCCMARRSAASVCSLKMTGGCSRVVAFHTERTTCGRITSRVIEELDRPFCAFAGGWCDADRGAALAAHLLHRFLTRQALHGIAVEVVIRSPGRTPGARRRGFVDRGDDLDVAAFLADLDASAAELAARLQLHVAVHARVHVGRMRNRGRSTCPGWRSRSRRGRSPVHVFGGCARTRRRTG